MADSNKYIDVTGNIKTIELLKSGLLKNISLLYEKMAAGKVDESDKEEILTDMIINVYLLSDKLGINYEKLDELTKNKLRLITLAEEKFYSDPGYLMKHFDK